MSKRKRHAEDTSSLSSDSDDGSSYHSYVSPGEWSSNEPSSDEDQNLCDVTRQLSGSDKSTEDSDSDKSEWSGSSRSKSDSSLYAVSGDDEPAPEPEGEESLPEIEQMPSPKNASSFSEGEEEKANAEPEVIQLSSEDEDEDDDDNEDVHASGGDSESELDGDASEEEGWPPFHTLIPRRWYAPMRFNLLVIANAYQPQIMNSYSGPAGGMDMKKLILKKICNYVNAFAPPIVHKTPAQCKSKLDKLRSLGKDKVTEYHRRLNRTGTAPMADKYKLTRTVKMANDLSGQHAVCGIPGTRESSIYPRWSEKRRKHGMTSIYKYHRKQRPDYKAEVKAKRASLKEEIESGVRGKAKQRLALKTEPASDDSSDEEVGPDGLTASERAYWHREFERNKRKTRGGRGGRKK